MAIYLGLDSSTQSLTATAIEVDGATRRVLIERSIVFDDAMPSYGTSHGVLRSDDPLVAVAPPLMWVEALERMMGDIAASGIDLASVRAIAGGAQQHGSVYLGHGAGDRLRQLDVSLPLAHQLRDCFSRPVSPVWMDASTRRECEEITTSLGGSAAVARLTGSRAFERFTGPQIRKFARELPEAYAGTERIHLVSSFLASLLAGGHAPVDPGDASGANLMDIRRDDWSAEAVRATAAGLAERLPPIRPSSTIVGPLAPYWRQRYGFPAAHVVAWSGDNPCSLVGAGLIREGVIAISLGTSDTVFGFMRAPRVDVGGIGHAFGSPTGGYMGLTCFRNGSLARESVRDQYGFGWNEFADAIRRTPPGNNGAMMLPWFEPEITPPVLQAGVHRFGLDAGDGPANVRAVVEAQMVAMLRYSRWMGVAVRRVHATGGGAANGEILQVMADVFGADVHAMQVRNTAALGAALRAYHAERAARQMPMTWDEVIAGFAEPCSTAIAPRSEYRATYDALVQQHALREAEALGSRR
jgi:xylulokinase